MVGIVVHGQPDIDHIIYIVNLWGTNIIVTVTSVAETWIEKALQLRSDVYPKFTFIVGFAIDPEINTLQFCVGHYCLIFQLAHAATIPDCLRVFMKDSRIGFPGFKNLNYSQDLKSSKHALEMFITPADLTLWQERLLNYSVTVDDMVKKCLGFRVQLKEEVMMSDWSVEGLSDEQVVYACVKTHCAFRLGREFKVWRWG